MLESLALCLASTVAPLIENGPSENRVDIVFVGDGYTQNDLDNGIYQQHAQGLLDYMFSDELLSQPFGRYKNYFNAHAIEIASNESGADVPSEGIYRDTALGGSYGSVNGLGHSMFINSPTAGVHLRANGFSPWEMLLAPVNDSRHGGTAVMPGGAAIYAAGYRLANEVALHELGHSFAGLLDEYGGASSSTWLPASPNLSKDPSGSKWSEWLGYEQEGIGIIGSYAGGNGSNVGVYRPSELSKMRSIGQPFDAIAREAIILQIYNYVDPFDAWGRKGSVLWVEPVDDEIISVEWLIDGVIAGTGLSFDTTGYRGEITARGYDPTDWVRRGREQLEQFVTWNVPEPGTVWLMLSLFSSTTAVRAGRA